MSLSSAAVRHDFDIEEEAYRYDGARPLLARLYRPRGKGPFPGIVEVHGGAWTVGDRFDNALVAAGMAAAGILVMSIDFRMPPEARYPASIADINYAIRWLKQRSASLGIAAANVGAYGSSSGGHQVMLAALRPHDARYAAIALADGSGIDATLKYAISCWGVLNPPERYRMARQEGKQRLVGFHDAYWNDVAQMEEGSPQHALERGAFSALPAALIIQGTLDDNVPHETADRFAAAYRSAGGGVELVKYEGRPHNFIRTDMDHPASIDAMNRIIAFVHQHAR